jgi:hypothetical protein
VGVPYLRRGGGGGGGRECHSIPAVRRASPGPLRRAPLSPLSPRLSVYIHRLGRRRGAPWLELQPGAGSGAGAALQCTLQQAGGGVVTHVEQPTDDVSACMARVGTCWHVDADVDVDADADLRAICFSYCVTVVAMDMLCTCYAHARHMLCTCYAHAMHTPCFSYCVMIMEPKGMAAR